MFYFFSSLLSALEATARNEITNHFLAPYQFKGVMLLERTQSPIMTQPPYFVPWSGFLSVMKQKELQ